MLRKPGEFLINLIKISSHNIEIGRAEAFQKEQRREELKEKIGDIISVSQIWILPSVGIIFTAAMWIFGLINHYSYDSMC